jgi:hypothetical protein
MTIEILYLRNLLANMPVGFQEGLDNPMYEETPTCT